MDHFQPVLVWDDYHGFVVAKRNVMSPGSYPWVLDLPYGFEQGGREIELDQVRLWWPLPPNPRAEAQAAAGTRVRSLLTRGRRTRAAQREASGKPADVEAAAPAQAGPVSPGEILRLEFLEPLGWSTEALGERTGLTTVDIEAILRGDAQVTNDIALRLGKCFNTSPEFWINLQASYHLQRR